MSVSSIGSISTVRPSDNVREDANRTSQSVNEHQKKPVSDEGESHRLVIREIESLSGAAKGELSNTLMKISIDEETSEPIVQIIDKDSGELKKQIPPQELMEISKRLNDVEITLFDKKV